MNKGTKVEIILSFGMLSKETIISKICKNAH